MRYLQELGFNWVQYCRKWAPSSKDNWLKNNQRLTRRPRLSGPLWKNLQNVFLFSVLWRFLLIGKLEMVRILELACNLHSKVNFCWMEDWEGLMEEKIILEKWKTRPSSTWRHLDEWNAEGGQSNKGSWILIASSNKMETLWAELQRYKKSI